MVLKRATARRFTPRRFREPEGTAFPPDLTHLGVLPGARLQALCHGLCQNGVPEPPELARLGTEPTDPCIHGQTSRSVRRQSASAPDVPSSWVLEEVLLAACAVHGCAPGEPLRRPNYNLAASMTSGT